jgi:hypothetical protein
LAGEAAAYGIKLESGVLRSFDGAAESFADKRRDFDAALLYIQNYRTADGQFGFGCGRRGIGLLGRLRSWRY